MSSFDLCTIDYQFFNILLSLKFHVLYNNNNNSNKYFATVISNSIKTKVDIEVKKHFKIRE
jgi:hypothetical protein